MAKRESISKKIRFEVFKRDLFTCQYCGKKAPDVILHIDHVHPHSKGGTNDILNLITSCLECNQGKGARTLSDTSVIDKQRKQIEELQERKNQIEMMLDWKLSLANYAADESQKVIQYFNSKWDSFSLNESGQTTIKGLVKKHGAIAVIEMIDSCYLKYGRPEKEDKSFEYVLHKVKTELKFQTLTDDEKEDTLRIREVLRFAKSKWGGWYFDYDDGIKAISYYTRKGGKTDTLMDMAMNNRNFKGWIEDLYAE